MKSARDELEECFNAIPRDGTNIKQEDDDNGYESIKSDTSVSFDQKVAELAVKIEQAPKVIALPRSTPQPVEPKAVSTPEPVPAVVVKQSVSEVEAILVDVVKEVDAAPPQPRPEPSYDALDISLDGKSHAFEEDMIVPSVPVITEEVESPARILEVMTEAKTVDKEISNVILTEQSTLSSVREVAYDAEGWNLTSPQTKFDEFYAKKRYHLHRLLSGSRLPVDKWREELLSSQANVECSYDVNAMYEQMKFIQGLKVRVTEIITRLNSQFYKWKRFMELMRAEAAALENLKVAQSDAAAWRHLADFEDYFSDLEELNESAEGVMKNLESGWNTLNRGVTIVLQAQGAERGMTRYDNQHGANPLYARPNTSQTMARAAMQAFEDADDMSTTSKIPVDDPWAKVKR